YHHRSRSDHCNSHGIEKLSLGEPMELAHHPTVQERNDREPAAKHEHACLTEIHCHPDERRPRRYATETLKEPSGRAYHSDRSWASDQTGRRLDEQRYQPAQREDPNDLVLRPGCDHSIEREDRPEQYVLRNRRAHELEG